MLIHEKKYANFFCQYKRIWDHFFVDKYERSMEQILVLDEYEERNARQLLSLIHKITWDKYYP